MPGSQRSTIIILKSSPARFATPASEQIRLDRRLWACKYTPGMAKKGDSQRELNSLQEAKGTAIKSSRELELRSRSISALCGVRLVFSI
jgi:hypothetical protein